MGNGIVPDTIDGKIQFFQSKVTPWTTNATAIGTTSTVVTAMGTKVTTASTKLAAAVAARAAAKTATLDLKAAVRDLGTAGADIIKQIRAKAATDGVSVYVLAQIPEPATPSPVGAPGTPTDFKAVLNPDGSLTLKWKCPNPAGSVGTVYQVARRADAATAGTAGGFDAMGVSGEREFTDNAVPAGAATLTYQITAVRSTAVGTAAQFIVNLGVAAGGEQTASVVAAPRLAA